MLKELWGKLFHKHRYIKIGFKQAETSHVRYSIRQYECSECGKTKWVDGRFDPYE